MMVDDLGRIPMSQHLAATLARAASYADAQAHPEVTLEHLLLALAEDVDAAGVLLSSQVDLAKLAAEVSTQIGRIEDRRAPDSSAQVLISNDLRRILEAAAAAARQGRRSEINGAIVLAAIVGDGKSTAAHLLRAQGLTFEQAIRALQRASAPAERPAGAAARSPAANGAAPPPGDHGSTEELLAGARERVQSRTAPPTAPAVPQEQRPVPPQAQTEQAVRPEAMDPFAAAIEQPAPRTGSPQPQPAPAAESRPPLFSDEPRRSPLEPQWQPGPGPSHGPVPVPAPSPSSPPPVQRAPAPQPNPPGQDQTRPNWSQQSGTSQAPHTLPPQRTAPPQQRLPSQSQAPGSAADPRTGPPPGYGGHPSRPPGAGSGPGPGPGGGAPPPFNLPQGGPPAGVLPTLRTGPPKNQPQAGAPPQASGDPRGGPPVRQRQAGPTGTVRVASGQLVENIPRRMRVGIPLVIEARVARSEVKAIAEGLQGGGAVYRHEVTVTKAMSVRLRAPDGGFWIETSSPETQWIENVLGLMADDFASWRWTVTPRERGKKRLQLLISARTVGADGLAAETALPDQVIDVKVGVNYAQTAVKLAGWMTAAVVGGVLAQFGEGLFAPLVSIVKQISGS